MSDKEVPAWHEESIGRQHNRDSFDCGEEALNEFLRRYARRNHEMGGAKSFVAVADSDPGKVLGFYSLAPASVSYAQVPEIIRRGLARYEVPVFRLARLAVDRSVQGRGMGGSLLLAAGRRCLRAAKDVGGVALLIDAKNETVARWYAGYGALPLLDSPLSLVMPLAAFQAALDKDEAT